MRIGLLLIVGLGIAAAVAISGSGALPGAAADDPAFADARADLLESLDRAGSRLSRLSQAPGPVRPGEAARNVGDEIERLRARRQAIVHALDSVSSVSDESWRGAMPGLRANVSDLLARVDRAEIAAMHSTSETDSLFRSWLVEVDRSLTFLEESARDSVFNARAHEVRALRDRCATVSDRIAGLSSADDQQRLRMMTGDELIAMRRELRALERAAGRRFATRFP